MLLSSLESTEQSMAASGLISLAWPDEGTIHEEGNAIPSRTVPTSGRANGTQSDAHTAVLSHTEICFLVMLNSASNHVTSELCSYK